MYHLRAESVMIPDTGMLLKQGYPMLRSPPTALSLQKVCKGFEVARMLLNSSALYSQQPFEVNWAEIATGPEQPSGATGPEQVDSK